MPGYEFNATVLCRTYMCTGHVGKTGRSREKWQQETKLIYSIHSFHSFNYSLPTQQGCVLPVTTHGQIHLRNSCLILSFTHVKRNIFTYIQTKKKIQCIKVSLWFQFQPVKLLRHKLFCCFMLPDLTSQHIVHLVERCFIYHFAKYNSWLYQGTMFNICLNINLHKPDKWNIIAGLCHQNCKSFYIAVNQVQVRILGWLAVWQKYFLTSKILHKEENKLPPNSKIQETDQSTGFTLIRYVMFYMC